MKISQLLKQDISDLDCEILLAYVLGVEREYLVSHSEDEVDKNLVDLFKRYLWRVKDGEPIAYIIGEKEFFGLNFYVDKRVLVPRPETEHLVEKVLEYLRKLSNDCRERRFRILDVGTGSCNIAVSIAKNNSWGDDIKIFAVDISEGALEVARLNVKQHGVDNLVEVYQSDLLRNVSEKKYDVIVANLPYISENDSDVSESVKKYEPNKALYGGRMGLELYKKMFQQIIGRGFEFGLLIGEFGFGQRENMEELLNNYFDQRLVIEKDLAGIDRLFCVYS